MIKAHYLKQLIDEATNMEYTEGSEFISRAISETTDEPYIRRVVIEENANLEVLAIRVEKPTQRDLDNYAQLPPPSPPARDLATEIDEIKASIMEIKASMLT